MSAESSAPLEVDLESKSSDLAPLPETRAGSETTPASPPPAFQVPEGKKLVHECALVGDSRREKIVSKGAIILRGDQKAVPANVVILEDDEIAVPKGSVILEKDESAVPTVELNQLRERPTRRKVRWTLGLLIPLLVIIGIVLGWLWFGGSGESKFTDEYVSGQVALATQSLQSENFDLKSQLSTVSGGDPEALAAAQNQISQLQGQLAAAEDAKNQAVAAAIAAKDAEIARLRNVQPPAPNPVPQPAPVAPAAGGHRNPLLGGSNPAPPVNQESGSQPAPVAPASGDPYDREFKKRRQ